jgi:hypothetical protein
LARRLTKLNLGDLQVPIAELFPEELLDQTGGLAELEFAEEAR